MFAGRSHGRRARAKLPRNGRHKQVDKAIDNPETLPVGETLGLAKKRAKYLRRHISLEQRIISNEKEEKKKRAVAADEPLPKMKWYDAQEADAQEADAQEANDQQEANKQEANQQ